MFECYTVKCRKEVITIKTITLRLPDDLHKQLKLQTVQDEITIQDFIISAIKSKLENRKKEDNTK